MYLVEKEIEKLYLIDNLWFLHYLDILYSSFEGQSEKVSFVHDGGKT